MALCCHVDMVAHMIQIISFNKLVYFYYLCLVMFCFWGPIMKLLYNKLEQLQSNRPVSSNPAVCKTKIRSL